MGMKWLQVGPSKQCCGWHDCTRTFASTTDTVLVVSPGGFPVPNKHPMRRGKGRGRSRGSYRGRSSGRGRGKGRARDRDRNSGRDRGRGRGRDRDRGRGTTRAKCTG